MQKPIETTQTPHKFEDFPETDRRYHLVYNLGEEGKKHRYPRMNHMSYPESHSYGCNTCMAKIKCWCREERSDGKDLNLEVMLNNRLHRNKVRKFSAWKSYVENVLFGMGFGNHEGFPTIEQVLYDDDLILRESEIGSRDLMTAFIVVYRVGFEHSVKYANKVLPLVKKYPHAGFLYYLTVFYSRSWGGDNSSFNSATARNLAEIADLDSSYVFKNLRTKKHIIAGTDQTYIMKQQTSKDKTLKKQSLFYDIHGPRDDWGNYKIFDLDSAFIKKMWGLLSEYLEERKDGKA